MRKIVSLALCLAMILLVFAGCSGGSGTTDSRPPAASGSEQPAPVSGSKEIKVGLHADVASMDPRNASSTATAGVLAHMFNKLVKSDQDMNIEPDLAESYEQVDDLTWRFNLRQDVTFHDGSKFTAADVVYTLDSLRDKDKEWRLTTDFSFMKAVAVNDYTVDISTEEPYPGLLLRLNYVMIIPGEYVESVGDEEFGKNPVGTGPYKFVSRVKDESIVCEAYDGFYLGKPAIDKIMFQIIPETASRMAALEAGDVLFSSNVPSNEIDRLNAGGALNVMNYPTSRIAFLNYNLLVDSPMTDIRVRQAINHAIDRDKLIQGVLDGYGVNVASLACPEYESYDPGVKGFDYDLEKAKSLMSDAGYAEGFTVEASYSQSQAFAADVMQYLAAELSNIGVKMELREMESNQQREMISAGTVSPLYMNAIGGPYANIDLIAKLVFSSGERYSTINDTEFDALREKAASAIDKAERDRLNSELQQMQLDKAYSAVLYQPSGIYAVSGKLLNWQPRADEMLLFYDCDLAA